MTRDRHAQQSLGTLYQKIKKSRVLMVGAGGIGCELLKNLVLTGFGEIHIVDLDTIDLSNLNRQFLFRREHIKKSKALVAKETAAKFNPHVRIEAHHANIKDARFGPAWFRGFAVVFNALDNLEARRHVNRMCLAADVPLIESGTQGFDGQVQVIKKGRTECYDCNEKPTPKTFPVCTIRSTPSQPIHCIVWAKSYLFTELFGLSESADTELDASENAENAQELQELQQEAAALKKIRNSMDQADFPRLVFEKVYDHDVRRLLGMEDMWKSRKPPLPLSFDEVSQAASALDGVPTNDQTVLSLAEDYAVFADSLRKLARRHRAATAATPDAVLAFDKDDADALALVAAAANLRARAFHIATKSRFDVKQMAGNIIPAIATTNAMAAGLCVLQAFKVLRGQLERAKVVFLERPGARVVGSEPVRPPRPDCAVCSVAAAGLAIDPARATLGHLVRDVLRDTLGYGEDLSVSREDSLLYDPDFDDNLAKRFRELGLGADHVLTVADDADENPRVNLALTVTETSLPADAAPVQLLERPTIARRPARAAAPNGDAAPPAVANGDNLKRKLSLDAAGAAPRDAKTAKTAPGAAGGGDDAVLVVDEGAIIIGDD